MTGFTPQTEQEMADILRSADGPMRIMGGGTRPVGHVAAGQGLSTSGLSGITLYEPGALTLIAAAGTPVEEIEAVLAKENQMLAFEPMDHRRMMGTTGIPTIGGVVAGNVSGPRRVSSVGACRDSLLGVRFVDGSGRVLSNGGRVMKNVTGYDLVKLMAGSWGTLGVLTEVSLKVLSIPETEASLLCPDQTPEQAVRAMSAALGSPFDVTGAAQMNGQTMIRIEGLEHSVIYRANALRDGALKGFELVTGAASAGLWADLRDLVPFAGRDGAVWRVSVKPTDGPRLVAALGDLAQEVILDWGGGLVWLRVAEAEAACARDIRAHVAQLGGHATLIRASADTRATVPVFPPEPAPIAALSRGLREKFDPRGILNPGLMEA